MQVGEFFAVEPKRDCPHVHTRSALHETLPALTLEEAERLIHSPCWNCEEVQENWFCLGCCALACSRYKNSHMVAHNADHKDHPLAISLVDLSFWCYQCEEYVISPKLTNVHDLLYLAKFKETPPSRPLSVAPDHECSGKYPPPEPVHNELPEDITSPSATGHTSQQAIQEFVDRPEVLEAKLDELAALISRSKHLVTYTGAGISTSANIPDYRGPQGVWTLRDRGLPSNRDKTSLTDAVPTFTHMALKSLGTPEREHFVISTNVDGLHYRSGLPLEQLSELHGNIYKEICSVCQKVYMRDYRTSGGSLHALEDRQRNAAVDKSRLRHATGRDCECGGALCDSIIGFNENLHPEEIERAIAKARDADVALVLGTSMRVSPANQLPGFALENGGELVIVNLQNTPFDYKASIRIWAQTDVVLTKLCERLSIPVPVYSSS